MTKKLLMVALTTSILFSVSACNTVKGVGRDIESIGSAGSRAIN